MDFITYDWTGFGEIESNIHHPISHTIIMRNSYDDMLNYSSLREKENKNRHAFKIISAWVTPKKIEKTEDGLRVSGYVGAYKQRVHLILHDKSNLDTIKVKIAENISAFTKIQNGTPMNIFLSDVIGEHQAELDKKELYLLNDIKRTTEYNISLPEGVIVPYYLPTTQLYEHSNGLTAFSLKEQVIREGQDKYPAKCDFHFKEDMQIAFKPIENELERRIQLFMKSREYELLKKN